MAYLDTQLRVANGASELYSTSRMRILKPEALQLGRVQVAWNPSSEAVTVNRVQIVRGGETIDVLKTATFQVIQREGSLEQSMLTGQLTALLEIPGVRVGDEIVVALSRYSREPTLKDHVFGTLAMSPQGMAGTFRIAMTWPEALALQVRPTVDLKAPAPTSAGAERTLTVELRDPSAVIVADGAPPRVNLRRMIDYSDFSGWADVSRGFSPLFARAAALEPNSPLRAEAARIAAASDDPTTRATAALRLVQDQVRYVYVGLDGGNFRPATADETWGRRFGDCKGKTALLLALLAALKIEAEPVLVSLDAAGGDSLDGRLPGPGAFNHVLVRARIGSRSFWLDGTRLGDRALDRLPPPLFRSALALRAGGAELENVAADRPLHPQFIGHMSIDASAGSAVPAKVTVEYVLRGDGAQGVRTALSAASAGDADRMLRSYWRGEEECIEPSAVKWRFDDATGTVVLSATGTGKPDWHTDPGKGRSLAIWGAGFNPPPKSVRPAEQDQQAPWRLDYPNFRCWATEITLPPAAARRHWTYDAEPMNTTLGGVTYWRRSALEDGVMRTVMSRRTNQPEISATEARAVNDAIAGFNNRMSQVYETRDKPRSGAGAAPPFAADVDWAADDFACISR